MKDIPEIKWRNGLQEFEDSVTELEVWAKDYKETDSLMKEMIAAWESLPEGHYDTDTIADWLYDDMKPVIDKLRKAVL